MIHQTCPCCQCHYPPHHAECTFLQDCPEECGDFNYAAGLRQENEQLRAEVGRLRMTPAEREAVLSGADALYGIGDDVAVATLRGLLARTTKEGAS